MPIYLMEELMYISYSKNTITYNFFEDFNGVISDLVAEDHPQQTQANHLEEQGDGEWYFYFYFRQTCLL